MLRIASARVLPRASAGALGALRLEWADGATADVHHLWLRDHCRCPACFDHLTFQREVDITQQPPSLSPAAVEVTAAGSLRVQWPCEHESEFDAGWLRTHVHDPPTSGGASASAAPTTWGAELEVPTVAFEELMDGGDDAALRWLAAAESHGLTRVTGVPTTEAGTRAVCDLIGQPLTTLYGELTTVQVTPNENDSAYSNKPIACHTDGTYWECPPGLQVFHCLRPDAAGGGASLFVDGFAVGERLRETAPAAFDYLSRGTPMTFYFEDSARSLGQRRRVFEVDEATGAITGFAFNNHDRGVLRVPPAEVDDFYRALRALMEAMRDPALQLRQPMQPGEFWTVHNRRVCHGREGFPAASERAIHTCYFAQEEFESRLRRLRGWDFL